MIGFELSMIPVLMLATPVWFVVVVAKVAVIEVLVHGKVCIGRMCVAKAQALSKGFAFAANAVGLSRRHCIHTTGAAIEPSVMIRPSCCSHSVLMLHGSAFFKMMHCDLHRARL